MPVSFPLFGRTQKGEAIDWLIVGLGNPGPKYEGTRHNIGFQIVNHLAEEAGLRFDEQRNKAVLARGRIENQAVALVKPLTFMNNSGEAVGGVARFYKIPSENILVIYDDLDLESAKLRLRLKGGSGGQKGMKSIIQHLGGQDFPRMRIGIGRPPGRMPVEAYVLQKFSDDEWALMRQTVDNAIKAIRLTLVEGIENAMNRYN